MNRKTISDNSLGQKGHFFTGEEWSNDFAYKTNCVEYEESKIRVKRKIALITLWQEIEDCIRISREAGTNKGKYVICNRKPLFK